MINLSQLTQKVFKLKQEEKIILKFLAEKPLNAHQIYKKTMNYTRVNLQRTGVENWLKGTQSRPGLIGLNFVTVKYVGKTNAKNNNMIYYLTTKGMMACLTNIKSLEEIYLFNKYCEFISERIGDHILFDIVKNFVKSQIQVFLAWHYTYRINLHELISIQSYFKSFFENIDPDFYMQFQKYDQESYQTTKEILEYHNISANTFYFIDLVANPENYENLKDLGLNKTLSKQAYEKMKYNVLYVEYWYQYLERFQDVEWKPMSSILKSPKFLQINSEKTKNKTKTILTKLGYDKQFVETLLHIMESNKIKDRGLTKQVKISEEIFENI